MIRGMRETNDWRERDRYIGGGRGVGMMTVNKKNT